MANQVQHTLLLPDDYVKISRERMDKAFKNEESLRLASGCLFSYIRQTEPSQYPDLSIGAIRNIITRRCQQELELNDDDYLTVISYFVGGRSRLLDMVFTYQDENTGAVYSISKRQMKEALDTGKFYHPIITDELVDDFSEHIVVTYKPSNLAEALYHLRA